MATLPDGWSAFSLGDFVTLQRGHDPRFVYYWFRANDLRGFNSGSAQASLNRNFLYRYLANIPRPAEQKAISALLGALDDKVELSRRMNETIMALVRAIATLAARDSAERKLAEVAAWERAIV